MTQSDKDFITRIQVSQLVSQDPYADDFYAQVYGAIVRSRMGLSADDERVLKFGASGGVALGAPTKGGNRRPNAMQRMQQQVERIVSNARKREEEKGLHCDFFPLKSRYSISLFVKHSTVFKVHLERPLEGVTKPLRDSSFKWILTARPVHPRPSHTLSHMPTFPKRTRSLSHPVKQRQTLLELVGKRWIM